MIRFDPQAGRLGFALPAVLAVTGVVTLIFLVAMTALSSLTAEAASARARLRFMARALTAEAAIAYMAATEPPTPLGVNAGGSRLPHDPLYEGFDGAGQDASGRLGELVHLDGRGYKLDPDDALLIRLQDQAGLINLASLTEDGYQRLGEALGLSPRFTRRLIPIYGDYIDQDDLERPSGAEAGRYHGNAPPNRAMRRPEEWLSLFGVRDAIRPAAWRQVRDHLAMDPASPVENVNTATAETMRVLYGATPAQIEAAMRAREQQPFLSYADFAAATGLPDTSGDGFYTFPSGSILLTVSDERSAWVYRVRLTVTPSGLERPVWIDQTELKEAPGRAVADLSNAVRLPYAPR